jgi:hypothetical protein
MLRRILALAGATAVLVTAYALPASADFPYGSGSEHKLPPGVVPNDLSGDGNDWKFAATAESGSPLASDPKELFGVRGAHVVDTSPSVDTAWQTTTGRPDVTLSVLDSGIRWDERETMLDLREKIRLTKAELPTPNVAGPAKEGVNCSSYGNVNDPNDANKDGVFNVLDYLCDSRVATNQPLSVGPGDLLDPQDLIIAFSDGTDADGNGFVDDIAGWDFLDNDNDAYDDVHYGHGTGEAKDSNAEANNGVGQTGSCPSCTVIPLRVGDSFVADASNFGQAVIYAVDNNVSVVQEALGTLNNSRIARAAVDYAYSNGVPVIASAADEAAQHHNWPSNYSHTIVVNSVNQYDSVFTPVPPSYLQFNGCTNFSTHITLAIPSSSCSSNATGVGAGLAGVVISAALNARDAGTLTSHPSCQRANGQPCALSVNEVRQLMASGTINGTLQADDVNFAPQPEPSCQPVAVPSCTDPNRLEAAVAANRPVVSPLVETRSYPARKDYDEFYGYGRANTARAVDAVDAARIPPEAEISSPEWYSQVDSSQPAVDVRGQVFARNSAYTCRVEVAPGSEPNNGRTTDTPPGDFQQVSSAWCDGTSRTNAFDGVLATVDLNQLEARFPATAGGFNGPEPSPGPPNFNNRPNTEPFGFVVRVVVTSTQAGVTLTGQDRRNLYLHRDQDLLPGFPKTLPSDGASSPVLADLDGDNRNELVLGTSDGIVHAFRRDGTELPGFPVHGDPLPLHTGGHAFTSGQVSTTASYAAILASVAVADTNHDGSPEVVAADMHGQVYVWEADGSLRFKREANIDFSGKPLQPFVNVRRGTRYRTQHGFIGSPVVADLDGNGGNLEIIAAGMDRHVYAWHADGTAVSGFPVLTIDRSKITAIDPQTHAPTFASNIGSDFNQGAIVDTPAVGDITGDGKPEIVVGTNEEYEAAPDGGFNAGNLNTASLTLLAQAGILEFANSRVYAIKPTGEPGGPTVSGPSPFASGWPVKVGFIFAELLPVVGEGITGSPVIGPVTCTSGGAGAKVATMSAAGPAYLFNANGTGCYGQTSGHDNAMQTDIAVGTGKYDTPAIPAVGHPTFGNLDGSGPSFIAPAAGVLRALDLAANEYQGGQDFIGAWEPATGQFRPGWPSPVNDLSFITGPSVADIDGLPGEEVLGGTASLDTYGFNAAGVALNTRWPKLSADWSVANPAVGSLGTQDTDASARKVVTTVTRAGTILVYNTDGPACSPSSWPRFHHDNASSGDYRRDAVSPGRPYDPTVSPGTIAFSAPGDDLLCGTANHYEVVQSNSTITAANFSSGDPVAGAPAPQAAGTQQQLTVPAGSKRFIGIRAVDEQGNVGRPLVVAVAAGYDVPQAASPLHFPLVPNFRQTISASQCTARGGLNSTHGAPLSLSSCQPPAYAPGTSAKQGPSSVASADYTVLPGNSATPADEADVTIALAATDIRDRTTAGDYLPNPAGADVTLVAKLRISDTYNGSSLDDPATVADLDFRVPVGCTGTASGSVGATCNLTTSADAVTPGSILEQNSMVLQTFRARLNDSGANGSPGDGDDRAFAQQGIYVP